MAKSTALAKMQLKHSAAIQRARKATVSAAHRQQHTLVAVGASFGIGWASSQGFAFPTFAKLDPTLLYGSIALIASWWIKDQQFRRMAQSTADGLLSVAAYKAGKSAFSSLFAGVAGEDLVDSGVF